MYDVELEIEICEECGVETDGFFVCDDCEEEVFEENN
jgi:hypothetical protein